MIPGRSKRQTLVDSHTTSPLAIVGALARLVAETTTPGAAFGKVGQEPLTMTRYECQAVDLSSLSF